MKNLERTVKNLHLQFRLGALVLPVVSALMIGWPFVQASAQSEKVGFKVHYSIHFHDMEIGNSSRTFAVDLTLGTTSTEYSVEENLMLQVAGEDPYVQRTTMTNVEGEVFPESTIIQNLVESTSTKIEFDWANRSINYGDGTKVEMPDHPVFDWESWLIALTLSVEPLENLQNQHVSIVYEHGIDTYVYESFEEATIEYGSQTIDVVKVAVRDINDSDNSYVVWVNKAGLTLPLQVDKTTKIKTINFVMRGTEPLG